MKINDINKMVEIFKTFKHAILLGLVRASCITHFTVRDDAESVAKCEFSWSKTCFPLLLYRCKVLLIKSLHEIRGRPIAAAL